MVSQAGHCKTETVVSVLLLILLAVIAGAIFFKQFDYDTADLGMDPAMVTGPGEHTKIDLISLLPADFAAITEPETFDPETLYVKINGKADLYLESGFIELACLRFASREDKNLWAEIYLYDMADLRNAFSVFSIQKRPTGKDLSLSRFCYSTENAVFLARNRYYAEVIASADSKKLQTAMLALAKNLARLLPASESGLGELDIFPKNDLVEHSFKLYLTNAFGFAELDNVFTAQYRFDSENLTAFIARGQNADDAKNIARDYYQFLIDNGAVDESIGNKTFSGRVLDFYGSTEIVFAAGGFVAGIHEAGNQPAAEKLAIILKNKLTEAADIGAGK